MLREFKEFAVRGNVVDMAVGIIIGGAFGTIVQSLVNDSLMPPIGLLLGGVDFQNVFLVLRQGATSGPYTTLEAAQAAGAVTLNVGLFVNAVLSFLIVAWAVFLLVRGMNRLRRDQDTGGDTPTPTTRSCPYCKRDMAIGATRCPHCTSQVEAA
ncbi:MAG: large conductance mechanosensitive channel protein MscL [Gemmatimonadota bacterium]